jgi:Ca2+-binding EF-hand superfamily protein
MGNQEEKELARLEEETKKQTKAEFDKLDTDKSGQLDKKEFRVLLERVAKNLNGEILSTEEEIEKEFNKFDKDGSGKISFDEVYERCMDFAMLVGLSKNKMDD